MISLVYETKKPELIETENRMVDASGCEITGR